MDIPPRLGPSALLRTADVPALGSGVAMRNRGRSRCAARLALLALTLAGCDPNRGAQVSHDFPPTPAEHRAGEEAFERHCSLCHGRQALGSETGPALVHPHYAPGHHADAAFERAVRHGVPAHHWRFGNMPPQPNVTPEEVERMTAYVRWLQREAGIR